MPKAQVQQNRAAEEVKRNRTLISLRLEFATAQRFLLLRFISPGS